MRLLPVVLASLSLVFMACGPRPEDENDAILGGEAQSGRYLVRLREPAPGLATLTVREQALELTARYGGTLVRVYERGFRGFSVMDLHEPQAQALASDPAVAHIEQDSAVELEIP